MSTETVRASTPDFNRRWQNEWRNTVRQSFFAREHAAALRSFLLASSRSSSAVFWTTLRLRLAVRLERGDLPLDLLLAQRESFLLHRPESDTDLQGDKRTVDRLGGPGGTVGVAKNRPAGMLENKSPDNFLRRVREIDDAGRSSASSLRPPGRQSGAWEDRRAASQSPGTPPPGHRSPRQRSASRETFRFGMRLRIAAYSSGVMTVWRTPAFGFLNRAMGDRSISPCSSAQAIVRTIVRA